MAPRVGFEPTTNGLTVHCSTAELPRNKFCLDKVSPLACLEHIFPYHSFRSSLKFFAVGYYQSLTIHARPAGDLQKSEESVLLEPFLAYGPRQRHPPFREREFRIR